MKAIRADSLASTLLLLLATLSFAPVHAEEPGEWRPLYNGRDLSNWDIWLGPRSGGYHDATNTKEPPMGLNHDPLGVFTIVEQDGQRVIRVSGEVFGAITTRESFTNVHIRVEYKWGQKKWPPRHLPQHYRDTGILYWCIGPHGAGSYAWMRSVECNIMEKGVGQVWSVAGSYVDIEGKKVVLEKEPWVPYRGEGPGEQCIVYLPGAPQFTTAEGITSSIDPEIPGQWNVCEVIAWGNAGIHLLNGEVVMVLTNPRYKENGAERILAQGKIQLQSEGAELYFRKAEARTITELPAGLLKLVPPSAPDERGFAPLMAGDSLTGWKQCGPGHFSIQGGVATGHDGMGLHWHTNRAFTNFVLRGEFKQEQPSADSGLFFRFPDPGNDPWIAVHHGHEVEMGDPAPEKKTDATGSFYPFHAPASVPVKPVGEWNAYELTCVGPNFSFRLNGKLVNTWTDSTQRPLAGHIGLQNYNDGKTVRHRSLRIKDLPAE